MLTIGELQAIRINLDVAREAHAQAEKRLGDALATKSSHEQKAFALLAGYLTVSLALFGAFGVIANSVNVGIAPAFLVAGVWFMVGAALSSVALLPLEYGALGSDPGAWLREGAINGDANALPACLAYETHFHKQRIDSSVSSNRFKAQLIRCAIAAGLIAPIFLVVLVWWLG